MSTQTEQGKNSSERLVILALLFLVPIIAIILLVKSFSSGSTDPQAMTEEAIAARIAPVAQYNTGAPAPVLASDANREPFTGEQVYNKLCMSCHDAGLLDAPKLGDNAAWGPRLAAGEADVYHKALNGFNAMPARGGDATLSDLEVKRAVVFMVNKSGGNFAEPTDGDAAPAAEATPATDAAQAVEQKAEAAVEATKEAAADVAKAVEEKTEAAVEATKEAAADVAKAVEGKTEAAVEATKEAATDAAKAVEQKTEAAVEATKEAAQAAEQKVEATVEAAKEAVAPAEVPLNKQTETDSTATQPTQQ
ncbi:MAG: c-type cytochrome [Pelistega sp.]|nr:c-type cytochrome [Pelistega sp.]